MLRSACLILAAAANAAALEKAVEVNTLPVVDMRLGAGAGKLLELPQIPATANLGVTALPDLKPLQALAPVPTAPELPVNEARLSPAGEAKGAAVKDGLEKFDAAVGKDEKENAGAGAGALAAKFFDDALSLRSDEALPRAEGSARIAHEIDAPPEMLRAAGVQATVPVYGSARILSPEKARQQYKETIEKHGRKPKSPEGRAALKAAREALRMSEYYTVARRLGELVARGGKGKVAVVTGGGPGIMEAANRGAFEAGGPSVGFNIKLAHEQSVNPYVTPGLSFEFEHFASREISLRHGALAMVFFPGGFGTMDEFFEIITLMQTGKIARRPLILIGEKAYWDKILDFKAFAKMGMISKDDLKLFRYAETAEAAWGIIRQQRQ